MRTLRHSIALLTVGHGIGLLAPLLTVPYLARVLRPEGWAPVLVAQAVANWVVLVVEFGFDLSATRALAAARDSAADRARIVAEVTAAKLHLIGLAMVLVPLAFALTPTVRVGSALMWWTLLYTLLRGLDPLWYFQGVERVASAVMLQALSRLAAALGVLFIVHETADAPRVLALQAAFALLSTAVLTRWMWREAEPPSLSHTHARAGLKQGAPLFAFRASAGFFASANVFVLSLFANPVVVGVFGGVERVMRAAIGLLHPLTQAILPRVSHLESAAKEHADALVQKSLRFVGAIGVAIGAVSFVFAPQLTQLLLGPGYEGAVPLMRLLAFLPPLVAIDTVLGLHWAVPFRHDKAFLRALVTGGVLNLVLAVGLAPRFGGHGVAAAIIAGEALLFVLLARLYRRNTP